MSTETPFFFENQKNKRLFGILHTANMDEASVVGNVAVVYCHPLFEEKLHSHRVMVNFARFAANHGIHVLRFDYFGDGESEGLFEQASVLSRITDILTAIQTIEIRVQPSRIFLLGLRMGATLAILAADKCELVSGVVAWSPIIKCKEYMYDMLRVNLSTQMVIHKKVLYNRDALVEQIQNGKTVNVDGYEISNPFYAESINVDLTRENGKREKPIFLVQISSHRPEKTFQEFLHSGPQKNINFVGIKERRSWTAQRIVYPSCDELFSKTIEWIKEKLKTSQ